MPVLQEVTTQLTQSSSPLSYRVRIINPKNKRDYMDLTWHKMSERFDSAVQLKQRLIESFSEYVPSTLEFQVGYLEGRGSQKRWIVRSEDLETMYDSNYVNDVIKLWCDGKSKDGARGQKHRNEAESDEPPTKRIRDEPPTKRDRQAEEEREIRTKLEKKHGDKYTGPQYTLWAKFITMGRHDTYDDPPSIPLMTGEQRGRPKQNKETISDALAGAATAITNALTGKGKLAQSPVASSKDFLSSSHGLSPNNQANLRRKHLEDLRMLSQLFDDGVLTHDEFKEQKQSILSGLKKLTYT